MGISTGITHCFSFHAIFSLCLRIFEPGCQRETLRVVRRGDLVMEISLLLVFKWV